jgi:branched-chain amino acid aminotransferase
MARVYEQAFLGDALVAIKYAQVSIASSAVLYGLSVYTVFPVCITPQGPAAFRLKEHYRRLANSCRIIGIDTFAPAWSEEKFSAAVRELVAANGIKEDVFVRATVHITDLVPGTRSRGLAAALSMFIYEAAPIVPQAGARLKTSMWRRNPDVSIPSRAKVNGGYVNSVLAKQDALDSGYDDCILLDAENHVCELSAANIFIVRGGTLITPGSSSDILEGINRATVIELARDMGIKVEERTIDVSELYIADEAFACGTSAFVAPVIEIDKRPVGAAAMGPLTAKLRGKHHEVLHGKDPQYQGFLTLVS